MLIGLGFKNHLKLFNVPTGSGCPRSGHPVGRRVRSLTPRFPGSCTRGPARTVAGWGARSPNAPLVRPDDEQPRPPEALQRQNVSEIQWRREPTCSESGCNRTHEASPKPPFGKSGAEAYIPRHQDVSRISAVRPRSQRHSRGSDRGLADRSLRRFPSASLRHPATAQAFYNREPYSLREIVRSAVLHELAIQRKRDRPVPCLTESRLRIAGSADGTFCSPLTFISFTARGQLLVAVASWRIDRRTHGCWHQRWCSPSRDVDIFALILQYQGAFRVSVRIPGRGNGAAQAAPPPGASCFAWPAAFARGVSVPRLIEASTSSLLRC